MGRFLRRVWLPFAGILVTAPVYAAAAGMPATVNFYQWLVVELLGLDKVWLPTAGALLGTSVCLLLGLNYRARVTRMLANEEELAPRPTFTLTCAVDAILSFLHKLALDACGKKYVDTFLPMLASFFIFILICNLSGLVPGLPPATESMSTTVALGLIAFLLYNYAGLREHGLAYSKQFFGPLLFIAPLFFVIEIFSHFSRPVSLSLRLMVNIFADHLLLNVFTGLTYLLVPAALLFFGLLVACLQSFVFTLLTSIYISMAVSHDH